MVSALPEYPENQRKRIFDIIRSFGSDAISPLVAHLQNDQKSVWWAAAQVLEGFNWKPPITEEGAKFFITTGRIMQCDQIGRPAVKILVRQMDDGIDLDRVAYVLGEIRDKQSVEVLISWLDNCKSTKASSIDLFRSLTTIQGSHLDSGVRPRWDLSRFTKVRIIEALGKIGDERALEVVMPYFKKYIEKVASSHQLTEDERALFQAARFALIGIGLPSAKPLLEFWKDENLNKDYEAGKVFVPVLEEICWQPGLDEYGALYWIEKGQVERCREISAPAVELLINALHNYKRPSL